MESTRDSIQPFLADWKTTQEVAGFMAMAIDQTNSGLVFMFNAGLISYVHDWDKDKWKWRNDR